VRPVEMADHCLHFVLEADHYLHSVVDKTEYILTEILLVKYSAQYCSQPLCQLQVELTSVYNLVQVSIQLQKLSRLAMMGDKEISSSLEAASPSMAA